MIRLEIEESKDAVRIVEALLFMAAAVKSPKPFLARRLTLIADRLGDAIDQSGLPDWTPDPLDPKKKEQHP